MPGLRDIARVLSGVASVSEWVIQRSNVTRRWRQLGATAATGDDIDAGTRVIVFRDLASGRGSASFQLTDELDDAVADLAEAAADRAASGTGPAWSLPPAAAPAQVAVADRDLARDLAGGVDAVVEQIASGLAKGYRIATARIAAERIETAVVTRGGFASTFISTLITARAAIAAGDSGPGEIERVSLRARRSADLGIAKALADATARLADRRTSGPLAAGTYDLLLLEDAITAEAGDGPDRADHFGWFSPFVAQASGSAARQGLSRYQPGQSVFGDIEPTGDPLTISSDGTLAFGIRSAPFGPHGEPIRRFDLVRDGLAAGLSLDLREAGMRKRTANGGVRNLVVGAGRDPASTLAESATLEVTELRWLDADPSSGKLAAEIGLGFSRTDSERKPITGGILTGDAFDLFARARLSSDTMFRGWYKGPRGILFPGVQIQ